MYDTTYHRDGRVTYWDVYQQGWRKRDASDIPDDVLATLGQRDRERIARIVAAQLHY